MKTEIYKKAIDNIFNIVGESVTQNIPTLDHIMGVDKMSPTDKIWYEAYKKYGNRNHTWQDFRDMFYGDIKTMQETVVHWKTWDEIKDSYFKVNNQYWLVVDMVKKYGLKLHKDSEIEQYKDEYPDLFKEYKKFKKLNEQAETNYTTFDPQYAKIEREFEQKSKAISSLGVLSKEISPEEKQAKIDLIKEYLVKMDNFINLKNGDFVIGERIEMYRDIILNDKKILMMAHNFDNLSDTEKIDLARMILNKSAKKTGTPTGKVVDDNAPDGPHNLTETQLGGYQKCQARFLLKGDKSVFPDIWKFLSILAHEDAHRIDYYNPEYGMIGTQLMKFVNSYYLSNAEIPTELYRKFATEQSSYYLSDTTAAALKYGLDHQNS